MHAATSRARGRAELYAPPAATMSASQPMSAPPVGAQRLPRLHAMAASDEAALLLLIALLQTVSAARLLLPFSLRRHFTMRLATPLIPISQFQPLSSAACRRRHAARAAQIRATPRRFYYAAEFFQAMPPRQRYAVPRQAG